MPSHSEKAASDSQLSVLAEEIRHFRKESQLSLEQLAEVSGVSRSMISKIERCETVPSTVILSKLAEALGDHEAGGLVGVGEREEHRAARRQHRPGGGLGACGQSSGRGDQQRARSRRSSRALRAPRA